MNDRFKFRWYSKIYNEMCDVNCIEPNNEFVNFQQGKFNDISTRINLGNGVLMQCTGLKDKNGKLVYEGDIVKVCDVSALGYFRERIGEVVYGYSFYPAFIIETTLGDVKDFTDDIEVIGNIYENKSLLESEEQ